MATQSTDRTIIVLTSCGVLAFLTWKLWPALSKRLTPAAASGNNGSGQTSASGRYNGGGYQGQSDQGNSNLLNQILQALASLRGGSGSGGSGGGGKTPQTPQTPNSTSGSSNDGTGYDGSATADYGPGSPDDVTDSNVFTNSTYSPFAVYGLTGDETPDEVIDTGLNYYPDSDYGPFSNFDQSTSDAGSTDLSSYGGSIDFDGAGGDDGGGGGDDGGD